MISHDHQCVFVHVPKTGGQSVEHVFLRLHGLTWETRAPLLLQRNDDPAKGPPRLAHLTAAEYVSCGHLTPEQFDAYFVFAFVRNPWARLVSEYLYRYAPEGLSFRAFLFEAFPKPGHNDPYRHVLPQYDFLYDDAGACLVDFVGRFEHLRRDFATVGERLGLGPLELPHVNRADHAGKAQRAGRLTSLLAPFRRATPPPPPRRPYPDYYDAEARAFVERRYRDDIATFGYAFGE